jgi:predicted nucleotidyltransferase
MRPGEVPTITPLLERVTAWARERRDVRGLALVGSFARDAARPGSDVDLVPLTDDPGSYVADAGRASDLGAATITRTREWGPLTERRLLLPSGLELEVGVVLPLWALTDPVDSGTRRVVSDGMRILHDPEGRLAWTLWIPSGSGNRPTPARRLGAAGASGRDRPRWTRRC